MSDGEELLAEALRRAEAVLFASAEPVAAADLARLLPAGVEPGDVLVRLKAEYAGRGVELVEIGGGWRFQTAADLSFLFEETRDTPRRLSRAALETLAIIAYCQPVTRSEIEEIRGVALSRGTLDQLLEIGWARQRGRRRTPGRPATYGTTPAFLAHFGLEDLAALPGREDLRAAGFLSAALPADFQMLGPAGEDEEDAEPFEAPAFSADFLEGTDPAERA
jgi:segregation and condensation protein B